jgi:hypothetical protein
MDIILITVLAGTIISTLTVTDFTTIGQITGTIGIGTINHLFISIAPNYPN